MFAQADREQQMIDAQKKELGGLKKAQSTLIEGSRLVVDCLSDLHADSDTLQVLLDDDVVTVYFHPIYDLPVCISTTNRDRHRLADGFCSCATDISALGSPLQRTISTLSGNELRTNVPRHNPSQGGCAETD